jgi:hypothetical protein
LQTCLALVSYLTVHINLPIAKPRLFFFTAFLLLFFLTSWRFVLCDSYPTSVLLSRLRPSTLSHRVFGLLTSILHLLEPAFRIRSAPVDLFARSTCRPSPSRLHSFNCAYCVLHYSNSPCPLVEQACLTLENQEAIRHDIPHPAAFHHVFPQGSTVGLGRRSLCHCPHLLDRVLHQWQVPGKHPGRSSYRSWLTCSLRALESPCA